MGSHPPGVKRAAQRGGRGARTVHPATLRPEPTVLPRTPNMQRSDWRGSQLLSHTPSLPSPCLKEPAFASQTHPIVGCPGCVCERELEGEEEERRREGGDARERGCTFGGETCGPPNHQGCCFAARDVPPIRTPSSPQNILFLKLSNFSFDKLSLSSVPKMWLLAWGPC